MNSNIEEHSLSSLPPVFISYSAQDSETAVAIDQWLQDHQIPVVIDRRDFLIGADIRDEIVRCVADAGKVVAIYSKASSSRPYTKLERRLAQEREDIRAKEGVTSPILLFFCIDETPLPPESVHRLAIMAHDRSFEDACRELLSAILERPRIQKRVDLSGYVSQPPWRRNARPTTCPRCGQPLRVINHPDIEAGTYLTERRCDDCGWSGGMTCEYL